MIAFIYVNLPYQWRHDGLWKVHGFSHVVYRERWPALKNNAMYLWQEQFHSLVHKPRPLFIEVPVLSEKSEQPCICVFGVSILPFPMLLILDFGTVLIVWHFFIFILFQIWKKNKKTKHGLTFYKTIMLESYH